MRFKEFVAVKQAQSIAEHIATLSETQAVELLSRLDPATVELVEAILNEVTAGTAKRAYQKLLRGEITDKAYAALLQSYRTRPRQEEEESLSRRQHGGKSPQEKQKVRRVLQSIGTVETEGMGMPIRALRQSQAARQSSRFDPKAP